MRTRGQPPATSATANDTRRPPRDGTGGDGRGRDGHPMPPPRLAGPQRPAAPCRTTTFTSPSPGPRIPTPGPRVGVQSVGAQQEHRAVRYGTVSYLPTRGSIQKDASDQQPPRVFVQRLLNKGPGAGWRDPCADPWVSLLLPRLPSALRCLRRRRRQGVPWIVPGCNSRRAGCTGRCPSPPPPANCPDTGTGTGTWRDRLRRRRRLRMANDCRCLLQFARMTSSASTCRCRRPGYSGCRCHPLPPSLGLPGPTPRECSPRLPSQGRRRCRLPSLACCRLRRRRCQRRRHIGPDTTRPSGEVPAAGSRIHQLLLCRPALRRAGLPLVVMLAVVCKRRRQPLLHLPLPLPPRSLLAPLLMRPPHRHHLLGLGASMSYRLRRQHLPAPPIQLPL